MHPGNIIQNYRLISKLGEGGMGEVWLGEHVTIGRKVAIKSLHAQYARNEKIRERFRNEAAALSRLQHTNIVALYDYIEQPDQLCLVMEYVEGTDLDELIQKKTGPLTHDKLAPIFRQMVAAIGHAHAMGIVHRDIKPSNFMVTPSGVVKVLDFGIAKLLDDTQQLTRTGMRMGTTTYMSPEQVEGKALDHRTDIYSLGVTLYVMATGKSPYDSNSSEFQVYTRIVNEPLPLARAIYPGASEVVERVIAKATAKRPEDRFQACEEFWSGASSPAVHQAATATNLQDATASQNEPAMGPGEFKVSKFRSLGMFTMIFMGILTLVSASIGIWQSSEYAKGGTNEYSNFMNEWRFTEYPLRIKKNFEVIVIGSFLFAANGISLFVAAIGIRKGKKWSKALATANLFFAEILGITLFIILSGNRYREGPVAAIIFFGGIPTTIYVITALAILHSNASKAYFSS